MRLLTSFPELRFALYSQDIRPKFRPQYVNGNIAKRLREERRSEFLA
jgi:hypothetical protein